MYKLVLNSGRGCLEDQEETITEGLETFEAELGKRGGPFFSRSKPGMLDYMIWPWCERADLLKLFGNQFSLRKDKFRRLVRGSRKNSGGGGCVRFSDGMARTYGRRCCCEKEFFGYGDAHQVLAVVQVWGSGIRPGAGAVMGTTLL